ncbi:Alpha-latrotoxin-Lhe1a [Bienertia sinuspersici]
MLLLKKHPELLKDIEKESSLTVIHSWAWAGKLWPFKCLTKIESDKIGQHWRSYLVNHLHTIESFHANNPLHCAASFSKGDGNDEEEVVQVIKFLIEVYEYESNKGKFQQEEGLISSSKKLLPPWYMANNIGQTPLHLAIQTSDEIALYLLSKIDSPQHLVGENPLFLAMELGRLAIVEKIIGLMECNVGWREFVYCRGGNILHVAAYYKEDVGTLLVDKLPEHINERNIEGKTPLEVASEFGAPWLVKSLLLKNPSCITKAPFSWIGPCKKAHFHMPTLKAFIDHCPNFQKLCLEQKDTPLHHIQLETCKEYSDFLMIPLIRGMKNMVDSDGATPLHRAIERKDMAFVESLFMTNWVFRDIKDNRGKTALDLLAELCDHDNIWTV